VSRKTYPRRVAARLAIALQASLCLAPAVARAQTADAQRKAAAEALFDEGKAMLEQGRFQEACPRFEQSQEIDPGVGTLLYLGECYVRVGKLASAWAIFREAASAASASGQGERARIAEDRARELKERLAELAILVPGDPPAGFEVLLDGKLMSRALYGGFFPIDSGRHQVVARAPGYEPWSIQLDVRAEAERQTVQVPALEAASRDQAVRIEPPPAALANVDTMHTEYDARPTLAYWVGGGGLVALAAGVVFGVIANGHDNDSEEYCVSDGCFDPRGEAANKKARDWALAANVAYGLGVVALGAGVVIYFTAGPEPGAAPRAANLRALPVLGQSPTVLLKGNF
jgi:tetratricopeptide (TPR) repeat protein